MDLIERYVHHERFIVKPQFKKYDKDGSGNIEKDELEDLIKDFGIDLKEYKIEDALRDMDTNEDGKIDYDEFCRWYFSG